MKTLTLAAVALAISASSAFAGGIKTSTANKYLNHSPAEVSGGCSLKAKKTSSHYYNITGTCANKMGGPAAHWASTTSTDRVNVSLQGIRTDQLFGIEATRLGGYIQSIDVNNNHPITIEYRNKKGW